MVGHWAFWEDQSKASLALITALSVPDQDQPNMSRLAGHVHVFAWKCTGITFFHVDALTGSPCYGHLWHLLNEVLQTLWCHIDHQAHLKSH